MDLYPSWKFGIRLKTCQSTQHGLEEFGFVPRLSGPNENTSFDPSRHYARFWISQTPMDITETDWNLNLLYMFSKVFPGLRRTLSVEVQS